MQVIGPLRQVTPGLRDAVPSFNASLPAAPAKAAPRQPAASQGTGGATNLLAGEIETCL